MSKHATTSNIYLYVIVIVAAIAMTLIAYDKFKPIQISFDGNKIPSLLGTLFTITLFIERSIEVLIALVRSPGAIKLENDIEILTNHINSNEKSKKDVDENKKLDDKKTEQLNYKFETKKLSLYVSFSIGIIVSAVGIRTLATLVDVVPTEPLLQKNLFNLVDIIITAGLLSGGSDGIHQIAQVYTSYMQAFTAKGNELKNTTTDSTS